MHVLWMLMIGIAAGWLAGQFTQGRGFGLVQNLIIGIVGAVLGGFVFRNLGFAPIGTLGQLVSATVGALLLLWLLRQFGRQPS